jgi:cephalosporin hydroxylase
MRKVFDKHGCDKGSRHGYERIYEPVFAPIRFADFTLLEIGVFRGASLAAWADYFPNATLIGVDTFHRIPPHKVEILNHPRVRWFQMDSTQEAPDVRADFIIDDGRHTEEAQIATMARYFPLLIEGGRYFIEDAPHLTIPGAKVHTTGRQFDSRILEVARV